MQNLRNQLLWCFYRLRTTLKQVFTYVLVIKTCPTNQRRRYLPFQLFLSSRGANRQRTNSTKGTKTAKRSSKQQVNKDYSNVFNLIQNIVTLQSGKCVKDNRKMNENTHFKQSKLPRAVSTNFGTNSQSTPATSTVAKPKR